MSDNEENLRDKLTRELQNYLKLSKQPGLSAGAKTVLQLQIQHIQNLIVDRYH